MENHDSPQRRVLIVEPSALTARHLAMLLEKEGYELFFEQNTDNAQGALEHMPVDVILLSADLPGQGAVRMIQALKRSPRHCLLPAILMFSSQEQAEPYREALKRQLFGGLIKPITSTTMLALLENAFTPLPVAGQEVVLELGSTRTRAIAKELKDRRLTLSLNNSEAFDHACLICTFPIMSMGRARWQATVSRCVEGGLVLDLEEYLGKEDQRQHMRRDLVLPVRYRLPNDHFRLGRTLDVSAGGLRLVGTAKNVQPGERIELSIVLESGQRLEGLIGEVSRSVANGLEQELGVTFLNPTASQQQMLMGLVLGGQELMVSA